MNTHIQQRQISKLPLTVPVSHMISLIVQLVANCQRSSFVNVATIGLLGGHQSVSQLRSLRLLSADYVTFSQSGVKNFVR